MISLKNSSIYLNEVLDSIIYIISYALILMILSLIFNTLVIDNLLYSLIAAVIIYILNKALKPILFTLTIPITGITMGLFYPCINILILKITDLILGIHFETHGIFTLFLTVILISLLNILMDEMIIKPLVKRRNL